jgi:CheY-like chemotaxis protein
MELASQYFSEITPGEEDRSLGKNVLLVEDDPFWQQVITRNIERSGQRCHISTVTSANEAINLLGIDHRFSLIIADNYLEGDKTGYELWWDCKKRGVNVPFLLTSGNVHFPEDIIQDLPVKFVAKPFVSAELRRTLADLLSQDRSDYFYDETRLPWLHQQDFKIELTLLLVTITLISFSIFLGFSPPGDKVLESLPPRLMAPPPAIKVYSPPSHVAHALRLRGPPALHHKMITPTLVMRVERIVRRADEILSMDYLIKRQSELSLMQDPVFERSD